MKKFILKLSMVIFIILAFIQCKDDPTSPTENKVLLPLAIGNYWITQTTRYDSLGNIKKVENDTIKIENSVVIGSEKYYYFTEESLARNGSDGFYSGEIVNDTLQMMTFLKYPGNTGDGWIIHNDTFKIISNNNNVTVPKGTFNCYKYYQRLFDENFRLDQYYNLCPGVGQVYFETYKQNNGGSVYLISKMELIDYKLN